MCRKEEILSGLSIYMHQGSVCVSNGASHQFLKASQHPWDQTIYFDREPRSQFARTRLETHTHTLTWVLAASIPVPRREKPFVANAVESQWLEDYFAIPEPVTSLPAEEDMSLTLKVILGSMPEHSRPQNTQRSSSAFPHPPEGSGSAGPAPLTPRSNTRSRQSSTAGVADYMIMALAGRQLLVKADQRGVASASAELPPDCSYNIKFDALTNLAYVYNETTNNSDWAASPQKFRLQKVDMFVQASELKQSCPNINGIQECPAVR